MASEGNPLLAPIGPDHGTPPAVIGLSLLKGCDPEWYSGLLSGDKHLLLLYQERANMCSVAYTTLGATQMLAGATQSHGATSFACRIGKDKIREEMKRKAKLAGVNVHYYELQYAPTGPCAVCFVGGESFCGMADKCRAEYVSWGATPNPIKFAKTGDVISFIGCFGEDKFEEEIKMDAKLAGVSFKWRGDEDESNAFVGGFMPHLVQEKPIEDCVGAGYYAS